MNNFEDQLRRSDAANAFWDKEIKKVELEVKHWKARAEAAEAALSLYGQHRPGCEARLCAECGFEVDDFQGFHSCGMFTPKPCTCGFSASPAVGDRQQEQP